MCSLLHFVKKCSKKSNCLEYSIIIEYLRAFVYDFRLLREG